MTLTTEEQRKRFFAKLAGEKVSRNKQIDIRSQGTTVKTIQGDLSKDIIPSKFNIEQLKGTDNIVVREKGRQSGVITTKDDLDRVLTHLEQQRKARLIQEGLRPQKTSDVGRSFKQKGLQL